MLNVWMAAAGIDPTEVQSLDRDTACDAEACLLEATAGRPSVSVISRPVAFGDDCASAAIVVSGLEAPPWCRPTGMLLDGRRLATTGTLTYDVQLNDSGTVNLKETGRVLGFPRRLWLAPMR